MAKRAYIEVDSVEGFRDIVSAGQPVLVDYYTDWCGPCRALAPVVERIAAAHAGSLRVVKVNIEAAPELAERAKVRRSRIALLPGWAKGSGPQRVPNG